MDLIILILTVFIIAFCILATSLIKVLKMKEEILELKEKIDSLTKRNHYKY